MNCQVTFLGFSGQKKIMMEQWKEMEGKKVFIELKSGRRYTGKIISYENHFIKLIDKFGSIIFISIEELNFVQEEK